MLAGPDGTAHRYRKLNPFTHGGEHERFRAGTEPVTVQIGDLRVTPFICYDLRFADVFWAAAPDTDVYLVPANWPAARRNHWRTLLRGAGDREPGLRRRLQPGRHGRGRHRARR